MIYYLLNGKEPVECDDILEWVKLFKKDVSRRVARTNKPGVYISTVFLGLDHSWGDGPPLLFETMVFGGELDDLQWRYSTWDQAVVGHSEACGLAIRGNFNKPYKSALKLYDAWRNQKKRLLTKAQMSYRQEWPDLGYREEWPDFSGHVHLNRKIRKIFPRGKQFDRLYRELATS